MKYSRSDAKQEMLDGFRAIVDAVRSGKQPSTIGTLAQTIVAKTIGKPYTNKEAYMYGNPPSHAGFNKPAVPVFVSTDTLVTAAKASTDTSSPRQSAIVKELTARFGHTKANEMIDDKKAKLLAAIKSLEKQFQAL